MSPMRYLPPLAAGVLLSCLLMTGCATEQALTEQTQPLQDQIVRLERELAASKDSASLTAQAQANSSRAIQSALAKQLATTQDAIQSLRDKLVAQGEQAAQTELRLNDAVGAARDATQRADALKAKLDATATAGAAADAALSGRLAQAEQRLKELSNSVQEALALATKEIFLANGREAFTVTLSEDKVLYPQNDPTLDSRDVAKLDELADKLARLDQEYHLDIQGHTDNTSTDDINYNLGKARAEVAKRYLHEKRGISISRMSAISYGANKPLQPNAGHNRRIFIRVLVLK